MSQAFTSKSGITMADVREMIGADYAIKRYQNTLKFTLTKISDNTERYFKFSGDVGAMYESMKAAGVDKFVDDHRIAQVEPAVTAEERELNKSRKTVKHQGRQNGKLIEELEAKKSDIVVQLMNCAIKRGSPEHIALREQLYEVREQLIAIPGYKTFADKLAGISSEEMAVLKQVGEAKKKERKEHKRELVGKKTPRSKSRPSDDEPEEVETDGDAE